MSYRKVHTKSTQTSGEADFSPILLTAGFASNFALAGDQ